MCIQSGKSAILAFKSKEGCFEISNTPISKSIISMCAIILFEYHSTYMKMYFDPYFSSFDIPKPFQKDHRLFFNNPGKENITKALYWVLSKVLLFGKELNMV